MEEEVVKNKGKKKSIKREVDFDEVSIASQDSHRSFMSSSNKLQHKFESNVVKESRCGDFYPSDDSYVFPLIDFFSSLVTRRSNYNEETNFVTQSKLMINIPHTVIFGIDDNPIMYFTNMNGRVVRVDSVTPQQVERKLTYGCDPEVFSVVQKKDKLGSIRSNNAQLLNAKQLKTILETQGKGKVLFQRYVNNKGPKACITRFVWNKHKKCIAYMISNRKTKNDRNEKEKDKILLTNCDNVNAVNVFKVSGKVVPGLLSTMKYLVGYLEKYWRGEGDVNGIKRRRKLKLQSLVCDFIKDSNNRWWLLQIKGFKLIKSKYKLKKKYRKSYIRLKSCKMCLNYYKPKELIYRMSIKMIYATECHLKQRAEYLPWFGRPEFNSVTDTSMWYESHNVCKNCFDMYLQEQKLSKVEMEFAKAIGIPVKEKTTENASILDNLNKMLTSERLTTYTTNNNKRVSRKKNCKSNNGNGKCFNSFGNGDIVPKRLYMYRLITFINEIRNVPENVSQNFSLCTKIFDDEEIIKINTANVNNDRKNIKIGKLRVYYFFVENEQTFHDWITEKKNIKIFLISDTNNESTGSIESKSSCISNALGVAKLELKQFSGGLIDKLDYMSLFSSKVLKLCSIRAIIGFVKMKEIDMSNIKVKKFGKIFIPNSDFFTADPLPNEWMEVIPGLSNELRLDKLAKVDKRIMKRSKRKKKKKKTTSKTVRLKKRPMSARISRRTKSSYNKKGKEIFGLKKFSKRPKSARRRTNYNKSARRSSYSSGINSGVGLYSDINDRYNSRYDLNMKKKRFLRTYGRKYTPVFGSVFASIQKESSGRLSRRSNSTGRIFGRSNSTSSLLSNSSLNSGRKKYSTLYSSRRRMNSSRKGRKGSNSSRKKKLKGKSLMKKGNNVKNSIKIKENNYLNFSKNEDKKMFKMSDFFYSFHIDIGQIKDLNSELDETWNLSYKVFYTQNEKPIIEKEYESFQLQENAPLEFDIKDTFYILTDEDNLLNYFTKERILKISLQKKYQEKDDIAERRVSFIDLSKLIGKNNIIEYTPFEIVKDNQNDSDIKFFNYNANIGDDEEIDDEEDVDVESNNEFKDQNKNCLAKIKIFLKKVKRVDECKNVQRIKVLNELKSYNIKIVKEVPK